ncbi:putative phage abortive infection protein [Litoreibacter ponti]|uniref:Putative phage abortive infection protein n=1 Tax=Litoreibacter ponti TaxID=1510457 RepID=A0A2T6BE93_9RHOB|nr:putative phage abortive infection protein [Litoreibacter ponti]PTX54388.1 putative phage abortive infection protein [Litoreibacter ponti]
MDPNEWGDMLAGVFSPLAFALAFIAIIIQARELKEQRNEVAKTNDNMEKQRFETTFFSLFSALERSLRDIDLQSSEHGMTVGRDCFRVFYTRLNKDYRKRLDAGHSDNLSLELSYRFFWNKHQLELSQYFRILESILRCIGRRPTEEREPYYELVRYNFSDQELLLTFYHAISDEGKPLREYAKTAKLFEPLSTVRLLDFSHSQKIDPMAFGSNPMRDRHDYKNPAARDGLSDD